MISVVIPLYNKAHTIVNTLNTVFAQTYQDFEVVIVNDGSTDNGVEVIQQHFNDSRIRIIHQKNAGVSAARNRGVDESKYEYIAFLDGDDEWHPEYLSTMNELITQYPQAGLFLCAGLIYNADGSIGYRIAAKYEGVKCKIDLFENPEVFSHTSGTIIKKNIFYKTHKFICGMNKFEDKLLTQAIALLTDTIYCGIPLSKYKGGVPGQLTQTNKNSPNSIDSEILYFNMIAKDYLNSTQSQLKKRFPISFKYILRHSLKLVLKKNCDTLTSYFWKCLSPDVKMMLQPCDRFLLNKHFNKIAIAWINLTKIRWRLYGFPYAGKKVRIDKIQSKYLNW